jgi:recombinational DNA repair ATPase RecF
MAIGDGVTGIEPGWGVRRLVDWVKEQDHWVRSLVAGALDNQGVLPRETLDSAYSTLLVEKELTEGNLPAETPIDLGTGERAEGQALRLDRLTGVEGVNALTGGQEITFNKRLTVLFGENAAGKSGYVRILKCLASVRSKEKVLPDVRKGAGATPPKTRIRYTLGEEPTEFEWAGQESVIPFTRMSVFDTRAVAFHVDEALNYLYTPKDLALFDGVYAAIETTRDRLDRDRHEMAPQANPFLGQFSRGTSIYPKVETLGAHTDLRQLETLATLSDEQVKEHETLQLKVRALREGDSAARLQVVRGDRELYATVENVARVIAGFSSQDYNVRVETERAASERFVNATERVFAGTEIPAVLSETWTAFIQAGEEYLRGLQAGHYPGADDRCIYCRQPLEEAASELIRKYRDYCNNELRQKAGEAKAAVATMAKSVIDLDLPSLDLQIAQRVKMIAGDPPLALTRARELIESARGIQESLRAGERLDATGALGFAGEVAVEATSLVAQADELIKDLATEARERDRLLNEAAKELGELEARLKLRQLLSEIQRHVGRAKWTAKADQILEGFQGLLRSLTMTAKAASEELLNRDFERLFSEELKVLRAPDVTLEFPGREGQIQRRKTLVPGYALSAILSDGEQKAVALADFLAEARLPKISSPVVLDDPINSLDYKRLRNVAERIETLSENRQVVVFTHNIWFAAELLARFEKNRDGCTYYEVISEDQKVGLIEPGSHPRWDTPKKIAGRINQLIDDARKATGVTREALVRMGYSEMRAWCEVVVEQRLLAGVTQRYQPNVRMGELQRIKTDKLGVAITVFGQKFDNACRATEAHSAPLETLGTKPTLDDLQADWKELQLALEAYES